MERLTILLLAPAVSLSAVAHHSRLEFADDVFEVEAVIVDVTWANPHPDLTVEVLNGDGVVEEWYLQAFGSMYTLTRQGISGDLFEAGQRVRLALRRSMRRERVFLLSNVLLPDELEVVLNRVGAPRWSANHVGGEEDWRGRESQIVNAAEENLGVFRVWSPISNAVSAVPRPSLTDAAEAEVADFDLFDNWNSRCEPPGMPIVMQGPSAFEFIDAGGSINLQGGHYEFFRTIHLVSPRDPETQPPSPLGYSVGRWEGNTLLVETSRINWPYFNFFGVQQSEEIRFTERFTLSDDQSRLDYELIAIDPINFTAPVSWGVSWLALGEPLVPVNNQCDEVRGL